MADLSIYSHIQPCNQDIFKDARKTFGTKTDDGLLFRVGVVADR